MRAVLGDLPKEAITGACTRQATARWHIVEGLDGELYARCHKDADTDPLLRVIEAPAVDLIPGTLPPKARARADRIAAELAAALAKEAEGPKPEAAEESDKGHKPVDGHQVVVPPPVMAATSKSSGRRGPRPAAATAPTSSGPNPSGSGAPPPAQQCCGGQGKGSKGAAPRTGPKASPG